VVKSRVNTVDFLLEGVSVLIAVLLPTPPVLLELFVYLNLSAS